MYAPDLLTDDEAIAKINKTASEPVQEPVNISVDTTQAPEALQAPKRPRGRPSNAEKGLRAPLSLADRGKRDEASRNITAIEIPGSVAERIRALRSAHSLTTEALLSVRLKTYFALRIS